MITTFQTRLNSKVKLTEDVYFFRFDLVEPKEINFIPGQYLILSVPQASGVALKRLYSIASPTSQKNSCELLIKIVPGGAASGYLTNLKEGEAATFEGPAGVFTLKENDHSKFFLVTGTGIAPARSMILSSAQPSNINLFWGLPYFKDVFLLDEFKRLAQERPNFHFKICLSRETDLTAIKEEDRQYFNLGHVDKGMNEFCLTANIGLSNLSQVDFYLCGDREVVESLKNHLQSKGANEENIIFEKF